MSTVKRQQFFATKCCQLLTDEEIVEFALLLDNAGREFAELVAARAAALRPDIYAAASHKKVPTLAT